MSGAAASPRVWVAAALVLAAMLLAAPAAGAAPGTIFYTTAGPVPGSAQLWSVGASGERPELLRRRMPVTPEGGAAMLAGDRKRVLCICRQGEIDSVRADGTGLRRLGELPRETRYDVITLSPTGWAYWVKGSKWIYGQQGDGKPRKIATFGGGTVIDERVVPSPDGRRLAVVGYGVGDIESVFTLRRDGSGRILVYRGSGLGKEIYDVAWSPDGSQLILSDGTGGESDPKGELPVHYPRQWFLVAADGSSPAGTVLPLQEPISNPYFSPDGARLAFGAFVTGKLRLTIAGLDGTAPRTLPGTGCRAYCEFAPRVVGWASL